MNYNYSHSLTEDAKCISSYIRTVSYIHDFVDPDPDPDVQYLQYSS